MWRPCLFKHTLILFWNSPITHLWSSTLFLIDPHDGWLSYSVPIQLLVIHCRFDPSNNPREKSHKGSGLGNVVNTGSMSWSWWFCHQRIPPATVWSFSQCGQWPHPAWTTGPEAWVSFSSRQPWTSSGRPNNALSSPFPKSPNFQNKSKKFVHFKCSHILLRIVWFPRITTFFQIACISTIFKIWW